MTNVKFNDYLREQLKDPEIKAGFDAENTRLVSALAVYEGRKKAGLTQAQLAQKAAVPQSTVARIENGENTSVDTLSKLAVALNMRLNLSFS